MINTAKEVLDEKGRGVLSIGASETVYRAIEVMAERHVGALLATGEAGGVAGIISERDYARKVILNNKSSRDISVSEIMTHDVISVPEDATVDRCMALMTHEKIRHLLVMDVDEVRGMITVGDLLKFIVSEQSREIEELESFIMDDEGGES